MLRLVPMLLLSLSTLAPLARAEGIQAPALKELPSSDAPRTLTLPFRSEAILTKRGEPTDGALETARLDYDVACRKAASWTSIGATYKIHQSDIPDLDSPSRAMDRPLLESVTCSEPETAVTATGFAQAQGTVTVTLKGTLRPFDESDRRIYDVTLPVDLLSSWGETDGGQRDYERSCYQLMNNVGHTSTLFATCEQPTIEIKCCGNATVHGAFHALVFAYAAPTWVSVTHTAKTALEVEAANAQYLAQVGADGTDAALSFCTPATFEYAPLMGYRSNCHALTQTFKSAYAEAVRCRAEITDANGPATVWARYQTKGGKTYLAWIYKSTRFQSSSRADATVDAAGVTLAAAEGLSLTTDGTPLAGSGDASFQATLVGLDRQMNGGPATVELQCGYR